jgi:hypothetical protein
MWTRIGPARARGFVPEPLAYPRVCFPKRGYSKLPDFSFLMMC